MSNQISKFENLHPKKNSSVWEETSIADSGDFQKFEDTLKKFVLMIEIN